MLKRLLTSCIALLLYATSIHAQQVVKFASGGDYPPFESVNSSGQLQGFDIDIANAICAAQNLKCVFSNQSWEGLLTGLALGKFDAIISAMSITDERKKQVDFSAPYFAPSGSFVAPKNTQLSITPEGLKGKTVGVQQGTTFEKYLNRQYKGVVKLKTYPNFQNVMLDLKANRVDIAFGDTPIIEGWLKTPGARDLFVLLGKPIQDPETFGIGYGIAIKKGNHELLNKINQGLADIKKDGTYDKIFSRYFPSLKVD